MRFKVRRAQNTHVKIPPAPKVVIRHFACAISYTKTPKSRVSVLRRFPHALWEIRPRTRRERKESTRLLLCFCFVFMFGMLTFLSQILSSKPALSFPFSTVRNSKSVVWDTVHTMQVWIGTNNKRDQDVIKRMRIALANMQVTSVKTEMYTAKGRSKGDAACFEFS